MAANYLNLPKSITWNNGTLTLLDQTQLPIKTVFEEQHHIEQVWDSIKQLKVRGAPAIGVAGAYGLVLSLKDKTHLNSRDLLRTIEKNAAYLDSARPTAVNLKWALTRLVELANSLADRPSAEICDRLEQEAMQIHTEDRQLCRGIGAQGLPLIQPNMGILTHCNAGSLATSELGTATAPMYLAHERGISFKVYADETRPLLQGSRLTSWELQQAGIDVTLLCDNMAAHIMSQGLIDLVIVGTDRVAANGDVANKIGTLGVAILANHFNIPFYVACPYSTIDFATAKGDSIVIEERGETEVTHFGLRRTAPDNIQYRNPAFDVTPHHLVTGIITERGIVQAPFESNLQQLYAA
ncbi:S-methyl-5-thioribose-1-phosphate isomerase [Leptothoe kymatousa]|uniref:Methylthioribose-1-phosphate isomerase n=1 Tax=Leptothoe kymatousa TAU-MAC 1615 TaxID=2364775 RepID=A0ABS5Y1Z0_9CYAN|nr:S-methyl-5-thioribose-1-phosphate isomerase [Leptothoe kymatousa]MBT9311518.1 S-methyl-5-thioribose-1-phosphate isomerase [Leptothoe kymatousa TAU-MAC 1615]